jgi:hypothetical protein
MSQEDFGQLLAVLLGKPWPRQAISSAEKGQRLFSATELLAFSVVIGCEIGDLVRLPADLEAVEMPSGANLTREQIQQATEAGKPTVQELRRALQDMVATATALQTTSFAFERRTRQLMDELDQFLIGMERQ